MNKPIDWGGWVLKFSIFLILVLFGLLVAFAGYLPFEPVRLRRVFKLTLPVVLLLVTFLLSRGPRTKRFVPVFLAFFAVALGFAIDMYVGNLLNDALGWPQNSPKGWAALKIGEVIPVIACILAITWLGSDSLKSLSLVKGRLAVGLLFSLIPMALLAIPYVTMGGFKFTQALPPGTLLSWLPWLFLFSIANGFFEELWFRGLWLPRFAQTLGPTGALIATSLVFTLMHVAGYWNQPTGLLLQLTAAWTILGLSCGLLTQKTGSLWPAVITHTFADVLFVMGTFASLA